MHSPIWAILLTIAAAALHVYWSCWLCLLITCEIERLNPLLDREYARLRRLCVGRSRMDTPLFQWLDRHTLGIWYRANRPFFAYLQPDAVEDLISAVGRIRCVETPAWALPRQPVRLP